jgi:hypothetical protein
MALIDYNSLVFTVKGLYDEDRDEDCDEKVLYGIEFTVSNPVFTMGAFSVSNPKELEDTLVELVNAIKKGKGLIPFSTDSSDDFSINYSDTRITFATYSDSVNSRFTFPVNESCKQMLASLREILEDEVGGKQ